MTYLTIALRKQLLQAILRGEGPAAFSAHNVSNLDQIALLAAADDLLGRAAHRTSPIRRHYRARRRMPLRVGYILAGTAALTPLAVAVAILCSVDFTEPVNYPLAGAAATLLGVFAAALGWGVASWTAHRNGRAQHTLNFLATRFSNGSFSDQAAIFNEAFVGKTITKALIAEMSTSGQAADVAAVQAMRYLLNWFECISVGVLLGDLDLEIVTKTVRSNLIFYTDRCLLYIAEVQQSQPRVLENLMTLRLHFTDH